MPLSNLGRKEPQHPLFVFTDQLEGPYIDRTLFRPENQASAHQVCLDIGNFIPPESINAEWSGM